jgi:hypothetical protein
MKTKNGKIKSLLAMALLFVFVMGFCVYVPNAEAGALKKHPNSQQAAGDSSGNVSPAPVVDASPINPDSGGGKKADDTLKQRKSSGQAQKKIMPRKP